MSRVELKRFRGNIIYFDPRSKQFFVQCENTNGYFDTYSEAEEFANKSSDNILLTKL